MAERKECGSNMEFDIIEKIILAVACPAFASALLVAFYVSQVKFEKRREQRWWKERKAEWVDCDQATYSAKLKGSL